ncbi:MAG: DUF2235 domain-containing protein [Chloroflexota bacterium]
MPKNIVILSDGTNQDGARGKDTNVFKTFSLIEKDTPNQIAHYQPGVGTDPFFRVRGNIGGAGFSKDIIEFYTFLVKNYQSGDNIYFFGYSRGAATVRSLSGFVDLVGLLPSDDEQMIEDAYNIYRVRDEAKRMQRAEKFKREHNPTHVDIKFLGVWDTVLALGIPNPVVNWVIDMLPSSRHSFHNLRITPCVENAYHALAIDERRRPFTPTVWDAEIEGHQTMKQVWFPGAHGNVGGGYDESGLSDMALEWMLVMAQQNGLRLMPNHQEKVRIAPNPDDMLHDSSKGFPHNLFRKEERSWSVATHGTPTVYQGVIDRAYNVENEPNIPYQPWIMSLNPTVEPWARLAG